MGKLMKNENSDGDCKGMVNGNADGEWEFGWIW